MGCVVAYASAVGTTLLMLHFLRRVAANSAAEPNARAAAGLRWPWLATAGAALIVPWALYLELSLGTVAEIVAPRALWASLWPVGVGAALAWMLALVGDRLPTVPPGDIAVVIDAGARINARASAVLCRLDGVLRQWAVAGVSLLTLAVLLGVALAVGR